MSGNSPLDGRMTEHPMTEATPLASEQITQEDREAAATLVPLCFGASDLWKANVLAGYYDDGEVVQAFARHRIAALSASPAPSDQGVSGEVERTEAQTDAWNDFVNEHLTDGNGYAAADMWKRCQAAFDAAWPSGWELANKAAFAALATPAPSCAPGEVERLRAAVKLTVADASHHLRKWRPHCLEALEAALSPQGLDAKEGGEVDAATAIIRAHAARLGVKAITIAADTATPSQRLDAATVERDAADARRYRYLRDHCSYHQDMTWDQPAEWSIGWDFQQCTPAQAYGSFDKWIDADIERRDAEEAQDAEEDARALATEPHQHGAGNGGAA